MDSTLPLVTLSLIAATVLVSMAGFSNPSLVRAYLLDTQAILRNGEHARIVSSGFLHGDWNHLLFNMISFYFFAPSLEQIPGNGVALLLAVYMGSIIGGNLLALVLHRTESYFALGASGGVCGVIFASIILYPGMSVFLFLIPIPIPGWLFAVLYVGFTVYGAKAKRDNIGHDAHLGGALVGLVIAAIFYPAAMQTQPLLFGAIVVGGVGGIIYLNKIQKANMPGRWE